MTKTCRMCGQLLPLEAFGPNRNVADGHRSTCLDCVKQQRQRTEKPCDRCGTIKPLADFPKNGASFDGHRSTCTACLQQERAQRREHQRAEWHENHLLGSCLERLRGELGDGAVLERIGQHRRATVSHVLELFAKAPHALTMRVRMVYEPDYMEYYTEFGLAPGAAIATIWLLEDGRRTQLYQVFTPYPLEGTDVVTDVVDVADATATGPMVGALPQTLRRTAGPIMPNGADSSDVTPTAFGRMPVHQWARDLLASNEPWVILDTETTGLNDTDQIIEVAAVDLAGTVLIDTLVSPTAPIPSIVTAKTGITSALVATAPPFAEVYTRDLHGLLTTHNLLIFNAEFDLDKLQRNIMRAYGTMWQPLKYACLMRAYMAYRGTAARHSLERACQQLGVQQRQAHRALGDCLMTLALLRAMAEG